MKKLQFLLPLLAMVLAIAGVGATTIAHQQKLEANSNSVLHWFTDPAATNYVQDNTVPDEMAANCPGQGDICEYGYKTSDFVNGDISQGLRQGHDAPRLINEP